LLPKQVQGHSILKKAKKNKPEYSANSHHWFNLTTVRGWIETTGAGVGVIGACLGLYLQLFPPSPVSSVENPAPGTNQSGPGTNIIINNYSHGNHEDWL